MKKTAFLHIGVEKTGSTTLQAVGAANRDTLKKRGILYPRSPGLTNHTGLSIYASTGGTLKDVRQINGLSASRDFLAFQERFPEELGREIEESGCSRIWLSNEHLSSRVRRRSELLRVVNLLGSVVDEVKVIIYIRYQPDLLLSHYSTKIRSGGIRELTPPRHQGDYFYNFALMLQAWADLWGKDALHVRIFDRSYLKGGDIVEDFFDAIGEIADTDIKRPVSLNQSLDSHALEFLRLFNVHVPRLTDTGLNPAYGQIGAMLSSASSGPRFTAPNPLLRQVAAMFEESNSFVAERYFGKTGEPLFPPRDYTAGSTFQPLSVVEARPLGSAVLQALDAQILNVEKRLLKAGGNGEPPPTYRKPSAVLQAATTEEAVHTTAILWKVRQQRLQRLKRKVSDPPTLA